VLLLEAGPNFAPNAYPPVLTNANIVAGAEARAVVFDSVAADTVAGAVRARNLPRIAIGGAEGGSRRFDEWPSSRCTLIPQAGPEDLSLLLYTSGTTGRPKGVPRRHRVERAAALAHVAQNLYGRHECTLGVMPLYHTMGIARSWRWRWSTARSSACRASMPWRLCG
jgi:long-subunit acyl-CoA synthetase (AMP-forming)